MPGEKFRKLSRSRQEEVLHELNRDIWDYPRWDDVLRHFHIRPSVLAKSRELETIATKARYGESWRGNGGSSHPEELHKTEAAGGRAVQNADW